MSYTVTGLLGRGGMSVVELAVDEQGREVARKRLTLTGSARQIEVARRRLRREAEILGTLRHPGIVPLIAVEDDGTDLILVMPRMVGSLVDRVETSGPLRPNEVVSLGRTLLGALVVAHRQGIVHRDIKPDNVLFDSQGRAALTDFGVAVTRELTVGLTQTGVVVGTPAFMSPEQAQGAMATPASDVFSLAATLGYALTGAGPFGHGEPSTLLWRASRGEVAPLAPGIPPDLSRVLTSMLSPRPEERPTAAAVLGGATGTRVDLRPVPPPPAERRGTRRSPPGIATATGPRRRKGRVALTIALASALVLAGAAAAGYYLSLTSRPTSKSTGAVEKRPPATTACVPLPYQPCGALAAAHTNGHRCQTGFYDVDGIRANGCEARSRRQNGADLAAGQTLSANLVPVGVTNTYRTYVTDDAFDLCMSKFHVTLRAPAGVSDEVQIVQGTHLLATAVSTDGTPATATASDPHCFHDDTGWVDIKVFGVGGASGADFTLNRGGHW